MLLLTCISLYPSLSFFSCTLVQWDAFLYLILFWFIVFLVDEFFFGRERKSDGYIQIKEKASKKNIIERNAKYIFKITVFLFIIGSIYICYSYHDGFYISINMNSEDVYASRLLARGKLGFFTDYFRNNAAYAVMPLLCTFFLYVRKYSLFFMVIIVQILLFSVDSIKAVLILTLLSVSASIYISEINVKKQLVRGILFVNYIVIIIYFLSGSIIFVDSLIKRLYFLPAVNSYFYYLTVNDMGNVILASSLLQSLNMVGTYVYAQYTLPFLVGLFYYGSADISANTGWFGAAYANGMIGLIFVPIVFMWMLKIMDFCTKRLSPKIFISPVIVYAFLTINSSISVLVTIYGFFICLFILYILDCKK